MEKVVVYKDLSTGSMHHPDEIKDVNGNHVDVSSCRISHTLSFEGQDDHCAKEMKTHCAKEIKRPISYSRWEMKVNVPSKPSMCHE